MPLQRAKDSVVLLQKLTESKERRQSAQLSAPPRRIDGGREGLAPLLNFVRLTTPVGNDDESEDGDEEAYWTPGEDWDAYEHVVPLVKRREHKKKGNRRCLPCFTHVPFCNPPAGDDGDSDEEGEDVVLGKNYSTRGGILKQTSFTVPKCKGCRHGQRQSYHPKSYQERTPSSLSHRVRFAPLKSLIPVCPLHRMAAEEKRDVWWQLADLNYFKAEIQLLSKPEEEEAAAALWFASRPVLGKMTKATAAKEGDHHRGSSLPLSSSQRQQEEEAKKATAQWYHKYGDSRRGLEKFASTRQAKQTIESYRRAIGEVLDEQRRQKFWKKHDPEKIAKVYHEYTAWSRDLALAAAASDEDAVRTNFDDSKRKSREFFLVQQIFMSEQKVHRHMPEFMIPQGFEPKGYLDEHAHLQ